MRRVLIAFALLAAAAAATAAIALGGGAGVAPKRALVTSLGLRAGTVLGSYCSFGTTEDGSAAGGCADAGYPLHPRSYLPVLPGSKLRVNVRKRAKSVSAGLLHVEGDKSEFLDGDVSARPVKGTHRRVWRLRLPDDVAGANVLDVGAQFARGGDADWWAGVKPVERWP